MSADDDAAKEAPAPDGRCSQVLVDARAVPAIRHGRGERRPWADRGAIGHGGAATAHGSQSVQGKVPGGSFHRAPIVGAACHRACGRCRAAMPVPATDAPSLPHAPNVLRGVSIHDSPSAPGTVLGGPFRWESNGAIMYHGSPISRFEVALPTGERAPVAIPRPRSPWELPWATVPLGYHASIV